MKHIMSITGPAAKEGEHETAFEYVAYLEPTDDENGRWYLSDDVNDSFEVNRITERENFRSMMSFALTQLEEMPFGSGVVIQQAYESRE